MRRILVIVGKPPIAGQVKTRLCPPLTAPLAAALHTAFLRDTVVLATALPAIEVAILYPPMPDAIATLAAAVGPTIRLLPQVGQGLGDALNGAANHLLAEGFDQVALISSDNPSLPSANLAAAFQALTSHDIALGPAEDGGYYLIGLTQPSPGLFQRITWSTSLVLAQTLERAAELGLRVAILPTWYDVDEVAGLRRLYSELTMLTDDRARHTRHLLKQHFPAGLDVERP